MTQQGALYAQLLCSVIIYHCFLPKKLLGPENEIHIMDQNHEVYWNWGKSKINSKRSSSRLENPETSKTLRTMGGGEHQKHEDTGEN